MLKTLHLSYSAIVADTEGGATEKEGGHDFQPSTIRGDIESLINDDTQQMILILKQKKKENKEKKDNPTQADWQEGKICPLPNTVKQSSFPTMYKNHLYSSLYEAYFAVLLQQYKHADADIIAHPHGIMHSPDFEFHNSITLNAELFSDNTPLFIEYKPTYPSEETLLHAFQLIHTSRQRFVLICYGNPLHTSNEHCLVKQYQKSKGCKRQKIQATDGIRVIILRNDNDISDEQLANMTILPPKYIDTRWVLAVNVIENCLYLCEHGRIAESDGTQYYIAEGVKADTSQLTLMKHPVLSDKGSHTACIIQGIDDDVDLTDHLAIITEHVTNLENLQNKQT